MFIKSNLRNEQRSFTEAEAQLLIQQHETVKAFFRRDSSVEIVNSLNTLVETLLFSEESDNVTSEMRVHIAKQLRVVTLITKLGETTVKW
ncbi:hypothetical protein [Dyadobacter psychrophilus]|uniref:Uncharacterized protein n=1 Tax=Dyadobacter psychrophilus TaxID=651661 RepID=A0A1T5HAX1_9BACT|nr:hypothetical protein [Dyadobacter psychrophilus]SKC17681.1 hypothetical protein SAMN05660293_05173 [Dyadobacter psychrophilus]